MCAYGMLGSGKTMAIVIEALLYHKAYPKNPIYSNIDLFQIPRSVFRKIDNASVLFDINEACFVLLDELWTLADSRKGWTLLSEVMTMLLLRSRKKRWRCAYTEQLHTQIDKRIRYVTDYWIEPEIKKGWILNENWYRLNGQKLRPQRYDARLFYEDYDHEADPFTVNLDELKALWDAYRRKRGIRSKI